MRNVTNRIKEVTQPRGGYIKPSSMASEKLEDGTILFEGENIHPSLVGLAVDYLTRFMMGSDVKSAFLISYKGLAAMSSNPGKEPDVKNGIAILENIKGLDDESIKNACKAVTFDVWYRCPANAVGCATYKDIYPNVETISNIRTMVKRSMTFFEKYGPVTQYDFTFEPENPKEEYGYDYDYWLWKVNSDFGGYSRTVSGADGDFLTKDTLWDFKVSKKPPTSKHTLQILMYYVMGQHSGKRIFADITRIGIFNPRLNTVYTLDTAEIPDELIKEVENEIIRYGKPALHDDIFENPFMSALLGGIWG